MEVKVAVTCGRCGRSEEKPVQLEEAQDLVNATNKKSEELSRLREFTSTLDESVSPALIAYVRNEDGGYTMKTLDNLCRKPDAKRNKGCAVRVEELLKDVFELHKGEPKERKPRKPRTPKEPGTGNGKSSKGK